MGGSPWMSTASRSARRWTCLRCPSEPERFLPDPLAAPYFAQSGCLNIWIAWNFDATKTSAAFTPDDNYPVTTFFAMHMYHEHPASIPPSWKLRCLPIGNPDGNIA
ncbi:hypothetical protein PpBr36_08778 [Pyricularia pennisetigena]|uniref:hypothetical protein n=1 Tax=Pyricularia pennisetigena TaxID=1578925 RepID=UPI001154E7F7|nr:hypothetical protein PpBr36_08778 [Pyricularia pennisetigena]TLS24452.1 hypothetical protein PpBr36_08778 [Pyricularia pennisetigena]